MSIRQLPEDVISKIRSSAAITSLNGVVCGLLKNSLDAGATKVYISINYGRGNCTVEDNGLGICPSEFAEDGGLGKSHCTSKFPPSAQIHGKQGNFLASLAILSLVTVTSHHHRYNSHSSISIHHGQVLKRQNPSPPSERFESFDHGTRVAVYDLFGSLPVRVKHRATVFSDRSGLDKEWGRLIRDVAAILLAWPSDVSVSLRETKEQRELRLKSPENTDVVARASRLFTQASLADSCDAESWVPISASSGHITLKGCISMTPVATRRSQFISLGLSPISNDYGNNVLYEEVNKVFKSSSFGIIESSDEGKGRNSGINPATSSKLRKGVDRWPMFYFRILLKGSHNIFDMDDVFSQSQRDLDGILNLLRAVSYGFLKKHHMRPHKIQLASDKSPFSTATTRRSSQASKRCQGLSGSKPSSSRVLPRDAMSRSDSPFDDWNRVKVGLRTESPSSKANTESKSNDDPEATAKRRRLIGEGGKLLRKPFDSVPPSLSVRPEIETGRGEEGNISKPPDCTMGRVGDVVVKSGECLGTGLAGTAKRRKLEEKPKAEPSEWLQNVLRSWNNPIFEIARSSLPRVNDDAPATGTSNGLHQCRAHEDGGVRFEAASISLHGRVSRSALFEAEVISQVDRKFILMKLPLCSMKMDQETGKSCALVMLDQHAADERCRLEDLMAGYFKQDASTRLLTAIVEALERPLVFEVSGREGDLLQQYQDHLEAWGIVYKLQPPGPRKKSEDGCNVTVTALPPSILERCRGEPRLLVELMRNEAWKLNDEGIIPPRPQSAGNATSNAYTANFHSCPRGILELLHSRSCRSAIMFNDVLTKEECERLVGRLARCAFPFQCAHGRPSMVPLVDLGSGCRIGGWDEGRVMGGGISIWKRWIDG